MKTKKTRLTVGDVTLLRQTFNRRVDNLNAIIKKAAGDLYPRIWQGEIDDLSALFLKLTGDTLREDE